jgi:ppGpp synthetase/RelA/SpoT-type nucleotidyltranferase
MATSKTKGTSRKIKELKGIKPEKITDDQLKSVQNLINVINRNQLEIGSMEIKKHEIMHNIAGLRDELAKMQSEFEKDYGTYDVNIQDGTINYKEDVKAN